jgi:5-methylcytosine-specific restriction endonuclease McrA
LVRSVYTSIINKFALPYICKEIRSIGGFGLLQEYKHSMFDLLTKMYPEHKWTPWEINKVTVNYWEDESNRKKAVDWAGKQLNVKQLDDWYNVLQKVKGFIMKLKARILFPLLVEVYCKLNIKTLCFFCSRVFTLTTIGCHGNSKEPLKNFGMTIIINENFLIGLLSSWD